MRAMCDDCRKNCQRLSARVVKGWTAGINPRGRRGFEPEGGVSQCQDESHFWGLDRASPPHVGVGWRGPPRTTTRRRNPSRPPQPPLESAAANKKQEWATAFSHPAYFLGVLCGETTSLFGCLCATQDPRLGDTTSAPPPLGGFFLELDVGPTRRRAPQSTGAPHRPRQPWRPRRMGALHVASASSCGRAEHPPLCGASTFRRKDASVVWFWATT